MSFSLEGWVRFGHKTDDWGRHHLPVQLAVDRAIAQGSDSSPPDNIDGSTMGLSLTNIPAVKVDSLWAH